MQCTLIVCYLAHNSGQFVTKIIIFIRSINFKPDIKGTVEKPEFGGFQGTLLSLIKPYVANIGEQVKTQGMAALGKLLQKKNVGETTQASGPDTSGANETTQQAVESIKSLFGDKSKK